MLQTNPLTTRGTKVIAQWIEHNSYTGEFMTAKDVNEFKRMVKLKLWGDEKPSESFIKGAKLVNWDALFSLLHEDLLKITKLVTLSYKIV